MLNKYAVSLELHKRINAKIQACVDIANDHFKLPFKLPFPDVSYDCRGTTGGYAIPAANTLHFNPVLLNENVEDYVENTVPHEVAHIVDFMVHGQQYLDSPYRYGGRRRKRDVHGATWKFIMRLFGADPARCHQYDVENAQVKVKKKFLYVCQGCNKDFILGPVRHKKILRGAEYWCPRCGRGRGKLIFQDKLGKVSYTKAREKIERKQKIIQQKKVVRVPTKEVSVDKIISKKDRVQLLVKQNTGLSRNEMVNKIMTEIGMTQAGATTYLYNAMKEMKV